MATSRACGPNGPTNGVTAASEAQGGAAIRVVKLVALAMLKMIMNVLYNIIPMHAGKGLGLGLGLGQCTIPRGNKKEVVMCCPLVLVPFQLQYIRNVQYKPYSIPLVCLNIALRTDIKVAL